MDQELAKVFVPALADAQQLGSPAGARLPRHQPEPGGKVPPSSERLACPDRCQQGSCVLAPGLGAQRPAAIALAIAAISGCTSPPSCSRSPARCWYVSNGISKPFFAALLALFAREAGAGRERIIVLELDNAGWHTEPNLVVPDGIRSSTARILPELQPAEHSARIDERAGQPVLRDPRRS